MHRSVGVATSTHAQPRSNYACSFNLGSTDYFYDAIYRYHPTRIPIGDNYGLHAVRSELNEYPRTPGEQICYGHYASSFSVLVKFRAHNRFRFTILNIASTTDGETLFSIEVNMYYNNLTLTFGDNCTYSQVDIPLPDNRFSVGEWHRIGVAVDPEFISLYKDCVEVTTVRGAAGCTVRCDESVDIGVLESETNVCTLHHSQSCTMRFSHNSVCREQWT